MLDKIKLGLIAIIAFITLGYIGKQKIEKKIAEEKLEDLEKDIAESNLKTEKKNSKITEAIKDTEHKTEVSTLKGKAEVKEKISKVKENPKSTIKEVKEPDQSEVKPKRGRPRKVKDTL